VFGKALKLALTLAPIAVAIAASSEPVLARGGAGNIMNSPGYQRRLQESRQQLPQTGAQASAIRRHKSRETHRH
jgi:hypothetical protein